MRSFTSSSRLFTAGLATALCHLGLVGSAAAQTAPAPLPSMGTTRVHIASDRDVVLEREVDGPDPKRLAAEAERDERDERERAERGEEPSADAPRAPRARRPSRQRTHWAPVCTSPCDADLPLEANYRITGDGVRRTSPFHLTGRAGEAITITFDASTNTAFFGGLIVSSVGVAAIGFGALALLVNAIGASGSESDTESLHIVGITCLAAGPVATAGGLVLMLGNIHSEAKQSLDAPVTKPLVQLPAPTTVSLFSASF